MFGRPSITQLAFGSIFVLLLCTCLFPVPGCASKTDPESTGQHFDDSTITANVKAALLNDPSLQSGRINVDTFKGVVQLSGFVNSQESIIRAGQVTAGVPGVVSVKNELIVK